QLAQQLAVLVFLHQLREPGRAHEAQAAGNAGVVIGPDLIVAGARHLLPLPRRPLDLDVRDGGLEDEPDDRLLGPHRIREARMTAQHLPAVRERPGRQFVLVHMPCSLLPDLHTGGGTPVRAVSTGGWRIGRWARGTACADLLESKFPLTWFPRESGGPGQPTCRDPWTPRFRGESMEFVRVAGATGRSPASLPRPDSYRSGWSPARATCRSPPQNPRASACAAVLRRSNPGGADQSRKPRLSASSVSALSLPRRTALRKAS